MPDAPALAPWSIRPFRASDAPFVVEILTNSDPWKQLGYGAADFQPLLNPVPAGRELYVIETKARPAGFALLRLKFLMGDYLELFAIAEWARGHALGSHLLEYVESVVFSRGTNLFACVSDFNRAGRRFYERHGYQEVGPLPELLVQGAGEILIRKTIGPARAR